MRSSVQPRLMMTAAMAFFSIALTLNMAGVRLTSLRLADLRPQMVRSLLERRLTMASVPIVRYYDHSRFVDQVKSRVRELRGQDEGEGNGDERKETQPAMPGQTRQENRDRGTEGTGEQGREHQSAPVEQARAVFQGDFAQSGHGPVLHAWERSKVWIAQTIAA
jgi:hypothetical protein